METTIVDYPIEIEQQDIQHAPQLTTALIAAGIGNYGAAIATSPRRDFGVHYGRLFLEVTEYTEDCANLMIKNGWLEQPPLAPNYKALANQEK